MAVEARESTAECQDYRASCSIILSAVILQCVVACRIPGSVAPLMGNQQTNREEEPVAYQETALDLEQLFGAVLGNLQQNRQALNDADTGNHDHGDNMVDTFGVITRAMRETRGLNPSDQLAYAAETLSDRQSGSAQVYARGLSQASREFEGRQVTADNAMSLIQTLLGGGQAAPVQPPPPQQQSTGGLGSLLGMILGGGQQQPQQQTPKNDGLDMGDILRGGMAYMTTKARGGSNLEAIVNAVVAGSAMGSGYREQSSSLVVNTLMTVIQGMTSGR